MTIKASTGLRNLLFDTDCLGAVLAYGFINIYSGPPPATADAEATGTLLCVVSNNSSGTGILFSNTAGNGVLPKNPDEVWSGVNVRAGVAGYYRHVSASDTASDSATEPRLQGAISTAGADMNLTSVNMAVGATQTVDFYTVGLPTF